MSDYHLAQINIARMLAPIDDPLMQDFVAQLPPINQLAETAQASSGGFSLMPVMRRASRFLTMI